MCSYFTFKGKLSIKNNSIETPGMIFSSHFFQAADDKKIPTVIMLDFNEAFDSINHVVLMEKLKRTVVIYSALHWLRSFLSK